MTSPARLSRLHAHFLEAMRLSPERRHEYLASACADDPSMIEEVLALLEPEAQPGHPTFTEPDTSTPGEGDSAIDSDLPRAWQWLAADMADDGGVEPAPASVGRYRIIRELERGGMGVVYEAEQENPLRRVALKMIHPGSISRDAIRRFRQETTVLAQLRHPGIAQVFDAGTCENRPYFVMELIDGLTLLSHANNRDLDLKQRVELIARVCDAVQHAHQRGVIHRDLKPSNILVVADGKAVAEHGTSASPEGQPKVLDFGVACLADRDETASLRTEAGQVIGTVPYLSPEQAAGDSSGVDVRCDVYSLGVIAFELFTGKLPHETSGRSSIAACQVIRDHEPLRLGAVRRDLRGDIETIVQHALEKAPERRYQSAADFAADLRRFLNNEPIEAHAPSTLYRMTKFAARNRALVGGAAATFLVLLVGAIVSTTLAIRASQSEQRARWEQYRSAISAASMALASNEVGIARRHLESTDPSLRGWEARHLTTRLDQSVAAIQPDFAGAFQALPGGPGQEDTFLTVGFGDTGLARFSMESEQRIGDEDPRLLGWYRALSARPDSSYPFEPGAMYVPAPGSGAPRALRFTGWTLPPGATVVKADVARSAPIMLMIVRHGETYSSVVVDLNTGACSPRQPEFTGTPRRQAISGDGRVAAFSTAVQGQGRSRIHILDTSAWEVRNELDCTGDALAIALDHEGGRVAVSSDVGRLLAWEVAPGSVRALPSRNGQWSPTVTFSHDGECLSAGGKDGIVRIWDSRTMSLRAALQGHETPLRSIEFLRDGSGLISSSTDGWVRRWRLHDFQEEPKRLGYAGILSCVRIGERSSLLAVGDAHGEVHLSTMPGAVSRGGLRGGSTPLVSIVFSNDEQYLVTLDTESALRVFDLNSLSLVGTLPASERGGRLAHPCFSADGESVLFDWQPDVGARHWRWRTGEIESQPPSKLVEFRGPHISANQRVAVLTRRVEGANTTLVVGVEDGRVRSRIATAQATSPAALSSDGRTVAVVSTPLSVEIFETAGGRSLGRLVGHTRAITSVIFSPDGARLFTSDSTGTIWIWSATTFQELAQLRGHSSVVRDLAISADGGVLVSASGDYSVCLWRAPVTETTLP